MISEAFEWLISGPSKITTLCLSEIIAICTDHAELSGFAREYFEYLLKDASKIK